MTVVAVIGGITAYVFTCLYQWRALNRGGDAKKSRV